MIHGGLEHFWASGLRQLCCMGFFGRHLRSGTSRRDLRQADEWHTPSLDSFFFFFGFGVILNSSCLWHLLQPFGNLDIIRGAMKVADTHLGNLSFSNTCRCTEYTFELSKKKKIKATPVLLVERGLC